MKWINIKNRMPTYDEAEGQNIILLVYGKGSICPGRMLTTCTGGPLIHYLECLCKKEHFWKGDITHWLSIDLKDVEFES